ncbi:MAG: hypothetical protein ACT4QF_20680 [Sporichthyaceae bacterium]
MDSRVLAGCPGFFTNLFTFGIANARWVAGVNRELKQGGAGFWFAWFLVAFANYGLAGRLNAAHAAMGSNGKVSPLGAFFLTGFPFVGSRKRLGRCANGLAMAQSAVNRAMQPVG